MSNETNETVQLHTHRPMILSILCILAFIGSVIGVYQNITGFINAEARSTEAIEMINKKIMDKKKLDPASTDILITNNSSNLNTENFQKYFIGGIFSSLLALVGCFFMWKLKRTGFYSFALGTFFNVITLLLLYGMNVLNSGLPLYVSIGGIVFSLLFATQLENEDD